jgi:DNA-binding SARP family transcriptional activator
LDAGGLSSRSGGYRLLLGDVEIDLENARIALQRADVSLERGDVERAVQAAADARAVFDEPLLPGAEGPWVEDQRRMSIGSLVRALEIESSAHSASGDDAAAIVAAERAVSLEPYRESAYRALIRACAAAGNKAEALRQYERCREILSDELGVDPSPATQALQLAVLRDEPMRTARPASPVAATSLTAKADGLELLAQRRYQEAFTTLSGATRAGRLLASDWEALGEAAFWSGHHDESIAARQRAYNAYIEVGDTRAAARVALALASNFGVRSRLSMAEAWTQTAGRLLDGMDECAEHGFLAYVSSMVLQEMGMLDESLAQSQRAFDIGRRCGVADLEALGLILQGIVLARRGSRDEAVPLLDEVMARATSGSLSPFAAGQIYCRTVRAWLDLWEYRRAAEWIQVIEERALETRFAGYAGDCHAHLAAALVARGSLEEAQREAERACEECETFELSHVGLASYTLGEIHLRRGDLNAAEAAFRRASEYGVVPQPGLSLLQAARGDLNGALASLRTFLDATADRLRRVPALAVAVQTAFAVGDDAYAEWAARELSDAAAVFGSSALDAVAQQARGTVAMSQHHFRAALSDLRRAADFYRTAEMPYELAHTRRLIGLILRAAGDGPGGEMELAAAQVMLERLGARRDAAFISPEVVSDQSI